MRTQAKFRSYAGFNFCHVPLGFTKTKLLLLQQANGINLDNYQASKFQRIVQALQMVSLNFDTLTLTKHVHCLTIQYIPSPTVKSFMFQMIQDV